MSPENFVVYAKAEQEKWINPVGRLILAAASIERSVNEILNVLSSDEQDVWRIEDFSKKVERISAAKKHLPDSLVKSLKEQKKNYWPVMANRNAIAHNPLYFQAFEVEGVVALHTTIRHQLKDEEYELSDVEQFANEADEVAAKFMIFAMNFQKSLDDEINLLKYLLSGMHLKLDE
jgi:hypothetical protein